MNENYHDAKSKKSNSFSNESMFTQTYNNFSPDEHTFHENIFKRKKVDQETHNRNEPIFTQTYVSQNENCFHENVFKKKKLEQEIPNRNEPNIKSQLYDRKRNSPTKVNDDKKSHLSNKQKNEQFYEQFKKKYDELIEAFIPGKFQNLSFTDMKGPIYKEHGLKGILSNIKSNTLQIFLKNCYKVSD